MDYLLAFAAGFLSFLTPCVLPLIPAYLGYIVGTSVEGLVDNRDKLGVLLKTFCFVIGFSVIFILFGISVSSLTALLAGHIRLLQQIGGVLIILFGLHITGLLKIKFLYMEKRFLPESKKSERYGKHAGAFLLGMAFAVGWTPCIGPILSSILIYAGSMDTIKKGVVLLILYSVGLATPFMLSALLIENLSRFLRKIKRHMRIISLASGVLVIIMGILVFTDKLEFFSRYSGFFNL